ncbi:hypothetical protein Adt_08211 [Abeliophyllum distichum]|uniref:Protein tweety homolog n=1 Tax=Abeliophyllum distichum TaxID=126358 RepID=A0ABD1VEH1_9LAMI
MFCFGSNPLARFLFLLSFFILATLFSSSRGTSHNHGLHRPHFPEYNEVVEWNTRRIVAETSTNSTYVILAAKRTYRKDPSNNMKYYTGGWNITNSHYLYSVAYSGVGPLIFAGIWLVFFGVFMLCLCFRHCCCRRKSYGYSRTAYAVSLILLLLFTTATIVGVGFLYAGQAKFQNSIVNIVSYILHQADTVVENLKHLLDNLEAAKGVGVGQISLPHEFKGEIDNMGVTINQLADTFHNVTGKNSDEIRNFLNPLRLAVIYVAAAVLVLALLGLLFSILGKKWVVYCLVIVGWILVAGTFVMSGMFLLVHNVVADTCVAMDEWRQNTNSNSALEEIIPKVDNTTAQEIFKVTKGVTFSLVSVVNYAIANVSNANNLPPDAQPLYFNQSGILMPTYCNPYNSDLTDRKCVPGEVDFTNASRIWKKYICEVSSSDICITTGRLTPDRYTQLASSVNVSYGLYTGMPFVVELIDSTFLTETLKDISENNCPSLRKYTQWVYVGFITSSTALMFSLIFWVAYVRERRHRAYTKRADRQFSHEEEASYIQG